MSELMRAVFGVAASPDSPAEEDASAFVVTTVVLCASVAEEDADSATTTVVLCTSTPEDNADLISEVTMTVVRLEGSAFDVCPLPMLSAAAVAVVMI